MGDLGVVVVSSREIFLKRCGASVEKNVSNPKRCYVVLLETLSALLCSGTPSDKPPCKNLCIGVSGKSVTSALCNLTCP